MNVNAVTKFRVKLGEILFQDEEDSVRIHYLQRIDGQSGWITVLELHLEGGRSWGDEIDLIYRHKMSNELLVHVSGFGYWGDAEFYRSTDGGMSWEPTPFTRKPDANLFDEERLEQV